MVRANVVKCGVDDGVDDGLDDYDDVVQDDDDKEEKIDKESFTQSFRGNTVQAIWALGVNPVISSGMMTRMRITEMLKLMIVNGVGLNPLTFTGMS